MFRLLESGPTKQQLWELPTSRPEFGNSQFGVRGFVITGLIRQVEENLELRDHNPDTVVETCEDNSDNSLILCEIIDRVVLSDILVTFIIISIVAINF